MWESLSFGVQIQMSTIIQWDWNPLIVTNWFASNIHSIKRFIPHNIKLFWFLIISFASTQLTNTCLICIKTPPLSPSKSVNNSWSTNHKSHNPLYIKFYSSQLPSDISQQDATSWCILRSQHAFKFVLANNFSQSANKFSSLVKQIWSFQFCIKQQKCKQYG